MTHEAWGKVCETLAKRIGKNNFTSWIEPLRWAGLRDGVARFEVPTTFFGDWVSRNYSDHILGLLNAEGHAAGRAEFFVPLNAPAAAPASEKPSRPTAAKPARARNDEELPGATLDARFTFDSFVVGKPNELGPCRRPPCGRRWPGHLQPAVPLRRRRFGQNPPDARDCA